MEKPEATIVYGMQTQRFQRGPWLNPARRNQITNTPRENGRLKWVVCNRWLASVKTMRTHRSKTKTEAAQRVRLAKKAGYTKAGKWWLPPGINSGLHASLGDYRVNPDDYPPGEHAQPLPSRDELRVLAKK